MGTKDIYKRKHQMEYTLFKLQNWARSLKGITTGVWLFAGELY